MLAERLRQFQDAGLVSASTLLAKMPQPIHEVQSLAEWIPPAAVHEWFLEVPGNLAGWFPPLIAVTVMTQQIIQNDSSAAKRMVWVGRSCWPTAPSMCATQSLRQDQQDSRHSINSSVNNSETIDYEIQPSALMQLRTGGNQNDYQVDAYFVKAGACFSATGKHYLTITFEQEHTQ